MGEQWWINEEQSKVGGPGCFSILDVQWEFRISRQKEWSLTEGSGSQELNIGQLIGDKNIGVEFKKQKWVMKRGGNGCRVTLCGVCEGKI